MKFKIWRRVYLYMYTVYFVYLYMYTVSIQSVKKEVKVIDIHRTSRCKIGYFLFINYLFYAIFLLLCRLYSYTPWGENRLSIVVGVPDHRSRDNVQFLRKILFQPTQPNQTVTGPNGGSVWQLGCVGWKSISLAKFK